MPVASIIQQPPKRSTWPTDDIERVVVPDRCTGGSTGGRRRPRRTSSGGRPCGQCRVGHGDRWIAANLRRARTPGTVRFLERANSPREVAGGVGPMSSRSPGRTGELEAVVDRQPRRRPGPVPPARSSSGCRPSGWLVCCSSTPVQVMSVPGARHDGAGRAQNAGRYLGRSTGRRRRRRSPAVSAMTMRSGSMPSRPDRGRGVAPTRSAWMPSGSVPGVGVAFGGWRGGHGRRGRGRTPP